MIYAVIVSYHPDVQAVEPLLVVVASQVDKVVIVDNGSSHDELEVLRALAGRFKGVLIENKNNVGVAEAINQGFRYSKSKGAEFVLLLDQDSLPDKSMVNHLHGAYQLQFSQYGPIAAVGPFYSDVKGQDGSPFVRLDGCRFRRVECNAGQVVEVDHLISSGSLIPLAAFDVVGEMESSLFIDYVDTEWCLRAKKQGFKLYGVGNALMLHDLGDRSATFLGRSIPVHSALRYYYLVRNGIWLLKKHWISWEWRVMDCRRLILIYVVFSFFRGSRLENWKMMSRGIWHGLIGKMGKLEDKLTFPPD